jgi:hypothetical protein
MDKLRKAANQAVALGEDVVEGVELDREPHTIEERVTFLEQTIKQHTISLDSLYTIVKELQNNREHQEQVEEIDKAIEVNKSDNRIPVGTRLKGTTKGTPFWCIVKDDGFYVGITKYESLSAAAQGVSGVRRSGWTFWKFEDGKNEGRSVKEVYK